MPNVITILLTGGAATRMQPLSEYQCKSMISFMGRPLLLHLMNALRKYNFTNIICTSSGRLGEIEKFFSDGRDYGVNIKYYEGKKWCGTAGVVKNIIMDSWVKIANTIMVIYGDSLLKANYEKMLQFHRKKKSLCTILFHRPDFKAFLYDYHDQNDSYAISGKRTNYGVLDLAPNGKITYVEEKPLLSTIEEIFSDPVANATVYLLEREVLEYIPSDRSVDFPRDLFPMLIQEGVQIFGFDIEMGYRLDIGTLNNYYQAHVDVLDRKIEFDFYFPSIEEGIWVAETSTKNSVGVLKKPVMVGENCKIGERACIEHSIVGNNVNIGRMSSIKDSIILDDVQIGDGVIISQSIIGNKSLIGDNVSVPPMTIVGTNCLIGGAHFISFE